MTNLEYLVKNKPFTLKMILSGDGSNLAINKHTMEIRACDGLDCIDCYFSGTKEGCPSKIREWLGEEHIEQKLIKQLTQEDIEVICHGRPCDECPLNLQSPSKSICAKDFLGQLDQFLNTPVGIK